MNTARQIHQRAFETFLSRTGPRVLGFNDQSVAHRAIKWSWELADATLGAFQQAWGDLSADGALEIGLAYVAFVGQSIALEDKDGAAKTLELGSRYVSTLAEVRGVVLPASLGSTGLPSTAPDATGGESSENAPQGA